MVICLEIFYHLIRSRVELFLSNHELVEQESHVLWTHLEVTPSQAFKKKLLEKTYDKKSQILLFPNVVHMDNSSSEKKLSATLNHCFRDYFFRIRMNFLSFFSKK